MSTERSDKPRRRRRLTEDEHRLWSGVARSVVPLKRKPAAPRHHDCVPATTGEPSRRRPEPTPQRQAAAKPVSKPVAKPTAPPVVRLDRRQKQRLARGSEPIDGRIDLHGKTQSEAHAALLGFLRRAQAEGARFVLVITGKGGAFGGGAAGEPGILKRQVPMWLRLPEFRLHVLAVEDAHRAHGGEGALYVRLRRARRLRH
ncbi:MAG TPA: Smr/MutS family protein [Xanthobacteraceae bacterium]|jgi:DNA-nicking Smr family endonuclease